MRVLQSLGSKSCSDMEVDGVAKIGRRDGSASRRELTRAHAKKMVEIREAKRAALKASGRRRDLYGWTGTRLEGDRAPRSGIEESRGLHATANS